MVKKKEPKSLFRRLTRLFKSGPVVKRKIRALDTALAVADKTKSSGTLLFQKSLSPTYATITSNAYNLSERLMRYQDFQEMEYSVSYQTLVPTPEGLKQIGLLASECEADPNKTFIVYAYDHERKKIVPALGKQARQTCVDHAWKVTFDNGKEITASAEHRLMLRDGSYSKVEDLQPGDAMMPFYRRDLFANAENGTKGYSWVYTMDERFRGWTKEHQLIAEWIAGRQLTEDECVHHINFNKTDNRPENLRIMSKSDHDSYHAAINNNVKWAPENNEWIEKFKKNHAIWMRDNAPTRRRDVTFSKIVQVAEKTGFSLGKIASVLDIDNNLIKERLVSNGFCSFDAFKTAYSRGCNVEQRDRTLKLTRELSIEQIDACLIESDTKASLAIKLGCTVNVLDKFLSRRVNMSWEQIRTKNGLCVGTTNATPRRSGRPKGKNGSSLTFQQICDAYTPGLTLPRLSEKLNVNKNTIISRLAQNGYKKYSTFQNRYQNCKVVSIEYVGEIPLYDLTVDGYKNFATDSVISHNTPEIASALDIYADETCSQDEKGRVLHIYSDNERIKEVLEDLFYDTLNVEFNLRSWVRNLVKYGDFFLYNDVSPEFGVVNAFPIPVNEIEREENYDREDPMAVRYRWVTMGNRTLENWEISHFRLLGNDMFLPYGSSVIEPARRIWRQLILIEDAMLVYRVVRAPERRVFYIDVANVPPENVPMYVEEQRKNLRTNQVIDSQTGRVDLRYNPLSVDEDYFIAVRGQDTGTKIDTLSGGQNTAAVEDVAYIQKKLFAALKIPRAYLGYDEVVGSKATLAQEDVRFSRTITIIQKTMLAELNKLAIIHLFAHGFDGDDLQDFTLRLSNPSTVAQQQKLELWRAKFEIGGTLPENMGSAKFVQREVWGLNDKQIDDINRERIEERKLSAMIDAIEPGGGEGGAPGGGGGGDDLFGGGAPEAGGAEPAGEATPPEENAGTEPQEEEDDGIVLLTSGDDDGPPVKAKSQLDRSLYNNSRHRTHGASKTHMPDYVKMTGNHGLNDPSDSEWISSFVTNPMGESTKKRKKLPETMSKMLRDMSSVVGITAKDDVLTESVDVQMEIDEMNDVDLVIDDGSEE